MYALHSLFTVSCPCHIRIEFVLLDQIVDYDMRIGNSVEGKKTLLGPYDKYCTYISSMVIKHSDPTPLYSLADILEQRYDIFIYGRQGTVFDYLEGDAMAWRGATTMLR
eukprot:COSAG02_NODE_194_length_29788_cov_20.044090_2_plen_109_part_00